MSRPDTRAAERAGTPPELGAIRISSGAAEAARICGDPFAQLKGEPSVHPPPTHLPSHQTLNAAQGGFSRTSQDGFISGRSQRNLRNLLHLQTLLPQRHTMLIQQWEGIFDCQPAAGRTFLSSISLKRATKF